MLLVHCREPAVSSKRFGNYVGSSRLQRPIILRAAKKKIIVMRVQRPARELRDRKPERPFLPARTVRSAAEKSAVVAIVECIRMLNIKCGRMVVRMDDAGIIKL